MILVETLWHATCPLLGSQKQKDGNTVPKDSTVSHSGAGSLAFLAGVITALVAAIALFLKKKRAEKPAEDRYDGWEESLGV